MVSRYYVIVFLELNFLVCYNFNLTAALYAMYVCVDQDMYVQTLP